MSFTKVEMKINKRADQANGDRKFELLGTQNLFVPSLKDILPFVSDPGEQAKDDKGNLVFEDGFAVYVKDEANWIQGALFSQARSQARNKIVPGTANLKPEQKIAETWEELCAEGERGQGAGLQIMRECVAAFGTWAKTQGLSEAAYNSLTMLFATKKALATQPNEMKAKVAKRVEDFVKSLSEEQIERFMRPLEGIAESVKPMASDAMDF